ncbi:MAG: YkgJ family cysteine cluster protein [Deltaproteobacteria bacterium]|nr:YkgJ family cysteine cluster protein [Deltaproteobacteria bacterium]
MKKKRVTICMRCGKCCLSNLFFYITDDDIERWKREGRKDILHIIENRQAVWGGDHFVSARDGTFMHGCPFLEWKDGRHSCSIYQTRPRVCRDYLPGSSKICSQYYRKI